MLRYKESPVIEVSLIILHCDFVSMCCLDRELLDTLTDANPKSFDVGELFIVESLNLNDSDMVIATLDFWVKKYESSNDTNLEMVHNAVYFASNRRLKATKSLSLVESAIYCATVDRKTEVLQTILRWHDANAEIIGQSVKLNADCMIHASLEDDRERLSVLYSFGYRLGTDTDKRINKDYLKRIKLFKARASPVYKSVVFEYSKDIYKDDPLKKCFEYARQARINATKIQDFTKEYMDIAKNCEEFAKGLLDKCTTKHEVQTLLQTKSYQGHMDANFNIAILDGHKEFVAHEKFQQLLHKKWGQRDRMQSKDYYRHRKHNSSTPASYNIFWSEMTSFAKFVHIIKQVLVFFFIPIIYIVSKCGLINCWPCSWCILQSQIPVNRFLYWEISKLCFYTIVLMTLLDEEDIEFYDLMAVFWIVSYLLENFRTIHRLYRYGGTHDGKRIFKRWLTFRNIYILSTDLVFLISLILRCAAYINNQCRTGCSYEGNEIAFVAASIWSIAALLTFLRSIQGGLMWRQTGPVIISISYMILDVLVFLFIFVIVYLSFTVCLVYVYDVYADQRTGYFNSHKLAFKLFFWAMIRTGHPEYADIYTATNTTLPREYVKSCVADVIRQSLENETNIVLDACVLESGSYPKEIEEGISYITGNTLWAFYQFTVVIVLLSILRARMVNTYHRVFKEADVQWKFFRASIWWKYLDEDTSVPPPFTVIYFAYRGIDYVFRRMRRIHFGDHMSSDLESTRVSECILRIKAQFQL